MFVEPKIGNSAKKSPGWIEVICGSMFSGKTEELIRRLNRAVLAQQQVEIFMPSMDRRYSNKEIISHNQNSIKSIPVDSSDDIWPQSKTFDVIGIDEAQFFDAGIVEVVNKLANQGKRVIIAGLDMDFKGKPFSPMDQLMATAEYITKLRAICMECGNVAAYSFRRTASTETVVLGEKDIYEALCRGCFNGKMAV